MPELEVVCDAAAVPELVLDAAAVFDGVCALVTLAAAVVDADGVVELDTEMEGDRDGVTGLPVAVDVTAADGVTAGVPDGVAAAVELNDVDGVTAAVDEEVGVVADVDELDGVLEAELDTVITANGVIDGAEADHMTPLAQ